MLYVCLFFCLFSWSSVAASARVNSSHSETWSRFLAFVCSLSCCLVWCLHHHFLPACSCLLLLWYCQWWSTSLLKIVQQYGLLDKLTGLLLHLQLLMTLYEAKGLAGLASITVEAKFLSFYFTIRWNAAAQTIKSPCLFHARKQWVWLISQASLRLYTISSICSSFGLIFCYLTAPPGAGTHLKLLPGNMANCSKDMNVFLRKLVEFHAGLFN